ncbi:MAG: phosphoenolpyruvate--protein phosphotransferase [Elusimicrobiales bacterium]
MIVKRGIGINVGIAIGKTFVIEDDSIVIEKKFIPKEKIKDEVARYKTALAKTEEEIELVKKHVLDALGKQHVKLIDAHTTILKDPLITKDVISLIISQRINAEYALSKKIEEILQKFNKISDTFFLERKNEILDISKKIIQNLTDRKTNVIAQINEPIILITNNLLPSDLINISKSPNVVAFCTNLGSKTSHTALFAQNMGIPAVVGLGDITRVVRSGCLVIVSSSENSVIIDPTPEIVESYKKKKEQLAKSELYLSRIKKLPTITRDGKKISLMVNLNSDDDLDEYRSINSVGIGLFRTEFLYINKENIPIENEQLNIYRRILTSTPNLPIVIRTADIGADKISNIGFKDINEANPFMGFRGIRLFLRYPDLLKTQLRAIYRASVGTSVHIMIPMVTNLDEIIQVKAIIEDVKKELLIKKIPFKPDIPLGVMIEIPSAALIVDYMLDYVDFVSIGTNDLIQYLLAVDRVNQYVSSMYDPFHPAVLRIINLIVNASHKKGKKVSVCGEMASDPLGCLALISLGVDSLSVPLKLFLKVKQHIRNINYERLAKLSIKILNESDSSKIAGILEKEMAYEFK